MTDPAKLIELADACDAAVIESVEQSRHEPKKDDVIFHMMIAANAAIVSQHLRAIAGRV
jgi:hypothetical protein